MSKIRVFTEPGRFVVALPNGQALYLKDGSARLSTLSGSDLSSLPWYTEMTVGGEAEKVRKPRAKTIKVNGGSVTLPPTNPPLEAVEELVKIVDLPVGHVGQSVKTGGNGNPTGGYKVRRDSATHATFIDGISRGSQQSVEAFSDWYRDLGPQSKSVSTAAQVAPKRERHAIC